MKRRLTLAVILVLVAGLGVVAWQAYGYLYARFTPERCTVANPAGEPVALTREQSRMSSIIVAASFQAGLPERAATVALATAYQESGIRNLDYGDRDSLGLFQQRPDPRFDWGTAEQIMDPWYSSLRFYEELVKFKKWESTDINDQAQKVQRSGHPQAYRKHVPNATALAATLRGSQQAAVTCVSFAEPVANPDPIIEVLKPVPGVTVRTDGNQLLITADDDAHLWAAVHLALLNTYEAGVSVVEVGDQRLETNGTWRTTERRVDGAVLTLGPAQK